jgi:hypothetical protein
VHPVSEFFSGIGHKAVLVSATVDRQSAAVFA